MKYTRTKVDSSVFSDIMPPGGMMYMRPELPKFGFKHDGVFYKVTDMRCLNEQAINVFEQILSYVCNRPNAEEISFNITGIDEDQVNRVTDIVSSIEYEAKKSGRNGYTISGQLLVTSSTTCIEDDEVILTFKLFKDHADAIYQYCRDKDHVNLDECVIAVAQHELQKFTDFYAEK
jgi:hypothetical protein